MPPSGLTPLQHRVVAVLAGLQPAWTLTGGAALVGVHGVRRTTRDIDLFFHGVARLERIPEAATARLSADGLTVVALQSGDAFHRLRISDGGEVVVLDLVADPVDVVDPPRTHEWSGTRILVDTPHEILVNKVCSLLGRSELRDLSDVADLLGAGGDLERALADAPRKDTGFSALTLAWCLRSLAIESLAEVAGLDPGTARRLAAIRDELVARITELARPEA